jgi:hypothetical protein
MERLSQQVNRLVFVAPTGVPTAEEATSLRDTLHIPAS